MGKLVIVIGQPCTGKTTLTDYMVNEKGFSRVQTITTRPQRPNEPDDAYRFVSKEEFALLLQDEQLIEFTSYSINPDETWYYGSLKESYNSEKDLVVVLNPQGMLMVSLHYPEAMVVWLDSDLNTLVSRGLARGDSPVEICRRLIEDTPKFEALFTSDYYDTRYFVENETAEELYTRIFEEDAE